MAIQGLSISGGVTKAASSKAITRIIFFLEDVERHYSDTSGKPGLHRAFQYLKVYFRIYPKVSARQSKKAIQLLGEVYESVGLALNYGIGAKEDANKKKTSSQSVETNGFIFQPVGSSVVHPVGVTASNGLQY